MILKLNEENESAHAFCSDFLVSEPVSFALDLSVPLEATGGSARILARLLFKYALTGESSAITRAMQLG